MKRVPVAVARFSLVLLAALAGCNAFKATPDQPAIKSNNAPELQLSTSNSNDISHSESVDIKDRNPDTIERKRARLHMELGTSYYQDGRFPVALDELKQAIAADGTFAEPFDMLALVYMALGEKALAQQSFLKALQLDPSSSDINNNYGWYLCQNGDPKGAMPYFVKALQNPLYGQPAKPLQNAGVCSLKQNDLGAAEDYFQRSFSIDPSGPVSAYNLALIFYNRKEYVRAEFYVTLVNKNNPGPESLWLGIRIEHKLAKHPEEASLSTQLEHNAPASREAELLSRHAYDE